jgi:hypothetical protein
VFRHPQQSVLAWSPPEWVVATSLCQSAGRYPPPHGILKQARQPDSGGWVKIDDYRCRQAFRHFMNLLNRAVYGAAFCRHGKRLRVLPVLEKGEVCARALRSWDRGTSGRWHIHCAIELPSHFDGIALENLICDCWAKVEGVMAEFLSATVQTWVGSTTCLKTVRVRRFR